MVGIVRHAKPGKIRLLRTSGPNQSGPFILIWAWSELRVISGGYTMNKMDDGTRKHLRAWIEHSAPVDEGKWDETEMEMVKVWEEDDYFQNTTWTMVFEQVKFG
jgi:hypothetical protein